MPTVYLPSASKKTATQTVSSLLTETDRSSDQDIPALGEQGSGRRLWFQKGKKYDSGAIATQPSVYDNLDTAKEYRPRDDWENLHRFDPSARWTWAKEHKLIRKIDLRIMVFTCIMFMAVQASGIIASNIYREDDSPRYKRGNRVLVGLVVMNILIYLLTKVYYLWRNASRDKK